MDVTSERRCEMQRKRKVAVAGAIVAGVVAIGGGVAIARSGGEDQPLTGSTLERAKAAALESTGGGTVVGSEAGDGDGAYEVEVRRDDGTVVDVVLDADFRVIGTDTEREGTDESTSGNEGDTAEGSEQEGNAGDDD